MSRRLLSVALLLVLAMPAFAADRRPARDIALAVEQALHTSGYRLRASVAREGAEPSSALKVTLVGERGEAPPKLLLRAVAPDAVRGQAVLLEAGADQAVRASGTTAGGGVKPVDAFAPAFGSDLVPWDFLSLWWRWPQQAKAGSETLLGYDCEIIESAGGRGAVARVRSSVATALRLPLKVEFLAADGRLLRTLRVLRVARRPNGETAAREFTIALPGHPVSRVEVYGGEEGLVLEHAAFSPVREEGG